MLAQLGLGAALLLVTCVVHGVFTHVALGAQSAAHSADWGTRHVARKTLFVSAIALLMFAASIIEIGLWAGVYLRVGALTDLETAVYFSAITFTSVGYGDVTLDRAWRMLSAGEAVNGLLIFGWSTAVIVAAVRVAAAGKPEGVR